MSAMNQQCTQITPSVNTLCTECPSVNFLKVSRWIYWCLSGRTLVQLGNISRRWLTGILLCATQQVNIDSSPLVAKAENVRIVPTFKIYKDGVKVKEMICPTLHVLRYSVRHYSVSSSWEALGTSTPISHFHWCIELPFSPSNLQHYQPPEHFHHLHSYSPLSMS